MLITEAKDWVRQAGETIKFDRCVGQEECDQVDKEVEEVINLLDLLADYQSEL